MRYIKTSSRLSRYRCIFAGSFIYSASSILSNAIMLPTLRNLRHRKRLCCLSMPEYESIVSRPDITLSRSPLLTFSVLLSLLRNKIAVTILKTIIAAHTNKYMYSITSTLTVSPHSSRCSASCSKSF